MFGNNQQSSPFGGGGFGQQQPNTLFGSNTGGGNPGTFGQPSTTFGSPPASTFGQQSTTSAFGASTGGGFGGAPTPFGQQGQQVSAFGTQGQAPGMAGTSAFGAPSTAAGGLFGAAAPAPFGSPSPAPGSIFGSQNTNTPFGGGQQTSGGLFGGGAANTNTVFGSSTAGAPTGGLFGSSSTAGGNTGGMFGTNTNTTFGQAPTGFGQTGSAFGSGTTTSQPGAFSAPGTGTFGAQPVAGLFGSPAPAPAPGGIFAGTPAVGNMAMPGMGVAGGTGTSAVPFTTTSKQDGANGSNLSFQSITAMPAYQNKSFEELRMEDYLSGNRGQSTPTASNTPGGFGTSAPSTFGSSGSSLFGSTPTTAPAPGSSLFGSAPAPTAFGSATGQSGGLFGSSSTPAPAPTGLFGSTTGTPGAFGSTPAPSGFGTTTNTTFGNTTNQSQGLFGAAPSSSAPGGLFTQPGTQTGFGGSATPSAFGSSPAPSVGTFGAPTPSSTVFGGQNPGMSGSQSFGSFPAAQSQPFGGFNQASNSAGAFGSFSGSQTQQPQSNFPTQFGQQQQQQNAPVTGATTQQPSADAQPSAIFPPNLNVVPPHILEMHKHTAETIKNLQDEVTKSRAWYPDSHGKTSTPTGLPSSNGGFNVVPPPYSNTISSSVWNSSRSPISGTKIQPRGHPWNVHSRDDNMPKAKMSELGRGSSVHSRSPHMQLVVKPNSLAPPRLILHGKRFDLPEKPPDVARSPPKDSSVNSPAAGSSLSPLAATNTFTPPATTGSFRHQGGTPMPSPAAAALYNQATTEEPNPITSPPAQASVRSSFVPTSTKAGYECQPSTGDLAKLSEGDLAAVSNFVVRRPGFGEVAWEGAVDVRGIDLDEVVQIQHGSIAVYPDEVFSATKPPVGTKLNRPATLTFEEMYPRGGARADADALDAYEAKLRSWTTKMGAEFISYERGTGQWKIRTFHFSRYGVLDDSEDDEPMPRGRSQTVKFAAGSTPAQKKSSIVRKGTPYAKPSNVDFEQGEVELYEQDDVQMSDFDVLDTVKYNVEQTYNDVFGIAKRVREATEVQRVHGLTSDIVIEEDVAEGIVDSKLRLKPDEGFLLEAKQMTSLIASLRPARTTINYGLSQGKTLRGSWSPMGAVCVPGDMVGLACKTMRPVFNETITSLPSVLRRLYSICKSDSMRGEDCPLFYLPPSLQNGGDESSHTTLLEFLIYLGSSNLGNEEVQNAFTLLAALLETPDASTDMVPEEDREQPSYTFDERRNHALLRWLTSVNAAVADRKISSALAENDLPGAVFAALSCGDINKATKIAMDGGAIDLAVVLSTGREGVAYVARMIYRLSTAGQSLPQELVRSLRVLCGQHSLEESLYRSGSDLSWQQRWALLVLQYPSLSLASLLAKYEDDVKNGIAPFPSPQHGDVKSSKAESVQFRILRAMAKPGSVSISDAVNTDGFSLNAHDLSLSFLLATVLSASGFATRGDCFKLELLTSGMEAQLLAQRQCSLAVVVCLYSFGPSPPKKSTRFAKFHRARTHVLRFFRGDDRSVPQLDFIPSAWKVDAMAYKADNAETFVEQLIKNKDYQEDASVVMEQQVLPKLFFENRIGSIAAYCNVTTSSVADAFLRLDTLMSQLQSGDAPGSAETALDEWESLEKCFKDALASNADPSPVSTSNPIDYKHMLQEGIHRAAFLRFLASSSGLTGAK